MNPDHAQSPRLGQRQMAQSVAVPKVTNYADLPTNPYDGQVVNVTSIAMTYIYNDATDNWVAFANGGQAVSVLNDLNDVTITPSALADRESLVYNAATSQWVQYGPIVMQGTADPPSPASSYAWQFYVKHP